MNTVAGTGLSPLSDSQIGGSPSIITRDFRPSDAGDGDLGVTNGTVSDILPTDMTAGGVPAFTITPDPSHIVCCLVVTAAVGGISSVEILTYSAAQTDSPAVGTASGTYYLTICDFAKDPTTGVITIGSGKNGIGSKVFNLRRDWFTTGPSYAGIFSDV